MTIFLYIVGAYLLIGAIQAIVMNRIFTKLGYKQLDFSEFLVVFIGMTVAWPLAIIALFFDV
jgi:hypothetical protein